MKIIPALGLGLALQLVQLVAGQVVDFNRALTVSFASTNASRPVSFLASEENLPPASLLASLSDRYNKPSHECFSAKVDTDIVPATVLIAVSKCLSDEELQVIKKWVAQVTKDKKVYNFGSVARHFDFQVAAIPGDCKEADYNKGYYGHEGDIFLSSDVQESDIARLATHFGDVGRVLGAMDAAATNGGQPDVKVEAPKPTVSTTPISVFSFVDNYKSYQEVELYERKFEIAHVINFNLCKNGKDKCKKFETSIELEEPIDIFLYNPFVVVRQLDCGESLEGGVPVSYLDDYGKRQCFCSCPAGYKEQPGRYGRQSCEQETPDVCPCVWSNEKSGYRVEVSKKSDAEAGKYGQCGISQLASAWKVPVPFPTDNYVADERNNIDAKAYVELTSKVDGGDSVAGSGKFAWKDYQSNNEAKVDALTYPGFGEYGLSLYAKDYFGDAECKGCVAIVDNYRPKATTTCPKSFCDEDGGDLGIEGLRGHHDDAPALTEFNLNKAQALVDEFYQYGEKAENDACSTDNRCDDQVFKQKDFFEKDYCKKDYDTGRTFFDLEKTIEAFVSKPEAKTNPLVKPGHAVEVDDCEEPVKPGQCTRCADLSTTLKEWWVDYKCNSAYDEKSCSGSDSCAFEQCLTLDGETFARAEAEINGDTKATSQKIIDKLALEGYQTLTQIHRSVQCPSLHEDPSSSTFSGLECSFTAALPSLISTKAFANFDLGKYANIDEFVFWRYKVDGGKWKLWNSGETETFENAKSNIYIEAWTQCGIVKKFVFALHLHPHSDVAVCDFFPNMWYQTSVSRLPIADTICTHPKSDFAELTFDYRPNIGLMYARDSLSMHVSDVQCELNFEGHAGKEILHVTKDSSDIIKRFAVEAINNAATAEVTKFTVSCAFTYKQIDDRTVKKTCKRDFTVKDCTEPEIDNPPEGECEFDNCAGKSLPGPYEACEGIVVKAAPKSVDSYGRETPATTYTVTAPQECCSSCDKVPLTCSAILDLPDGEDNIKRCEPSTPPAYSAYGYGYTNALMSAGHALVNASQDHAAVTALLGASAMVALVALVVVKRRSSASKSDAAVEDAYYPLLH